MSLCYSFTSYIYIVLISSLTFGSIQSRFYTDTKSFCPSYIDWAAPVERNAIANDYRYVDELGKAYKLHSTKATWHIARKNCLAEGARLAVVNSKAEADFLQQTMRYSTPYVFIGMHDLCEEGNWQTLQGKSVASSGYPNWGKSYSGVQQPDNKGGEENCGMMCWNGMLNDVKCGIKYPYFCEMDVNDRQIA